MNTFLHVLCFYRSRGKTSQAESRKYHTIPITKNSVIRALKSNLRFDLNCICTFLHTESTEGGVREATKKALFNPISFEAPLLFEVFSEGGTGDVEGRRINRRSSSRERKSSTNFMLFHLKPFFCFLP